MDGADRRLVADQRRHRLAPEAGDTVGQRQPILDMGIDAEAVFAGHVAGRNQARKAGKARQ